ncbi:hypothetical protein GQ44DRAFT_736395 [Phaeosphaeriaceae sp. PMI808]|nr:hypothetical protein GQ44DRAFT_736395 [Phaeosphaeriaceae sp. PMI808]
MSSLATQSRYSIANIGADGVGPEVIDAGFKFCLRNVPDHISLWGLRLAIRLSFQQHANVRPTKISFGTKSPLRNAEHGDLDWVVIRETSEGEYASQGGRSHREVVIFTRHGVERPIRFAFEIAKKKTSAIFDRSEVARDFPDVKMVLDPKSLDTIVATNLHANILSDLAAVLAGSISIAPTSNLDPTHQNPSMFEPIHGSAFDITGKGVANPMATFWTAAEMLNWLGEDDAAKILMGSVEAVTERGIRTHDLGGAAETKEVTMAPVTNLGSKRQAL